MNWLPIRRSVDDTVTDIIENRRFPTREQLFHQAYQRPGKDDPVIFDSFALMYATSYKDPDKADGQAAAHYNDAASTVNARPRESGVLFSNKRIAGAHHHDLPEDKAKHLAGTDPKYQYAAALVVIDIIHNLLHQRTGVNYAELLPLLTNSGKIILAPVESFYEPLIKTSDGDVVTRSGMASKLAEFYGKFKISDQRIRYFCNELIKKWQSVHSIVGSAEHRRYLPAEEIQYYQDTINDFISATEDRRRQGNLPEAASIEQAVAREFEEVRDLVMQGNLETFDRNLVLKGQSPTMQDIMFTIYAQRYITGIFNAALEQSREFARLRTYDGDHHRLAAAEIKPPDQRDVVTRLGMGAKPEEKISIAYKGITTLNIGYPIVRTMATERLPYERFYNLLQFLHTGLKGELAEQAGSAGRSKQRQTRRKSEASKLRYAQGLVDSIDSSNAPLITRALSIPGRLAKATSFLGI